MPFKNFKIWRGKLPHWRADEVRYYVTFRHRRDLTEAERDLLLTNLIKEDGKRWDLLIACVLPDRSEMIFEMRVGTDGEPYELANIVEGAKRRTGKKIIHNTGEKYPPFFEESYDRIIRDELELEERWQAILDSPVNEGLADEHGDYESLFVQEPKYLIDSESSS